MDIKAAVLNPDPESPAAGAPAAPVARRVAHVHDLHGDLRSDEYFWMREKSDPEVRAHLEAENAYTDAVMKPTEGFQKALYDEMLGRIKEDDASVPYRDGAWFYFSRTEKGKQYPAFWRKPVPDGPEELVLDMNALAEGQKFLSLGAWGVSDDGNLLAYSSDVTGFREYTLVVKDLRTGQLLPFSVEKTGSLAWASDNRTLFYTTEDEAKRSYRLWRHRMGEAAAELVFEETDELFRIGVYRSRSDAYLFVQSGSHTTTETRFVRADQPAAAWTLVAEREHEHEYDVDHHGDHFYIRTNDTGRNFRLVRTRVAAPDRPHWEEVVPHRADVMLEGVELFARHRILVERTRGLPVFRVTAFATGDEHTVAFPEPTYTAFPGTNAEFDTHVFRYAYESLVTPLSVFDYDLDARVATLRKEQPVLGGFDRTQYASERLWAAAPDGVKVPVSVVYRKPLVKDGTRPAFLYAYGSYGFPMPVTFSSNRLSLLDRGVIVCVAHIRGGGDLGKGWHDDGRMMKKMNTFTDFIAVADHLMREKWTAADRLVIEGGSAGGLLMGAVTNLRPDLFKAVVSKVPFVDVINTMSDASLPLTAGEWEEWGDPRKKDEYDYMRRYSPYDNLEAKAYPAMLVKTSFNDSQVMYWEPAKYVARLRTLKTDANTVILKTNMDAGHGGASGRYDFLREIAFDYAFILTQLGLAR